MPWGRTAHSVRLSGAEGRRGELSQQAARRQTEFYGEPVGDGHQRAQALQIAAELGLDERSGS